jgi:hypothetical protein
LSKSFDYGRNFRLFALLFQHSILPIFQYSCLSISFFVTEVNDHGAVPHLKPHNKSPPMVLILDGGELVGAKQNRIVNTTILIAGNATVVIPVSCVEQGRWAYNTPQFYSQERIMPSRMRARKSEQIHRSVRAHGEYQADQSAGKPKKRH